MCMAAYARHGRHAFDRSSNSFVFLAREGFSRIYQFARVFQGRPTRKTLVAMSRVTCDPTARAARA